MKNYLPILITFLIVSCSGTSYDGSWVMDAEKSSASCMTAFAESMENEKPAEDNPFGDLGMDLGAGMAAMACGMVANMFPPFEISGGKMTIEGNECSVDGGVLDCGDGDKSVTISMEGKSLVMGLPAGDDSPEFSLYFKRND